MYDFCHDKTFVTTNMCLSQQNMSFVATKVCLSRQNYVCHDKHAMTNMSQQNFCHDKLTVVMTNTCLLQQIFVGDNSFVATNIILSLQT